MIIKIAYRLIAPYWKSPDKKIGLALAAIIIGIAATEAWIRIQFNQYYIDFYNALQKANSAVFWKLVPLLLVVMAFGTVTNIVQEFTQNWLELRWRRGMVSNFLDKWLAHKAYYRIERNQESDNPDQRISEDTKQFVKTTMSLTLGFITMLMTVGSFSYLTWTKGGDLDTTVFGMHVFIPGFMFWTAIAYATVHTTLTHFAGRRLIDINFQTEAREADFRYHLVQVRDNAEQIAMYSGEATERAVLMKMFGAIWSIYKRSYLVTGQLGFMNGFMNGLSSLLPIFFMAPQVFAGRTDFGTMMGVIATWGPTAMAFGWFGAKYREIAQWRATTARLDHLMQAIDRPPGERKIVVTGSSVEARAIELTDIQLELPNGKELTRIGSLKIGDGDRWMITGQTGAGKSTLLRAIAGIWPFGTGTVVHPVASRLMFLPQKSYISAGTLKAALCYPRGEDAYSDDACSAALATCCLRQFADRLHERGNWSKSMSLGEQQRLAMARAILAEPDILFLDEATSAVDPDTEAALYGALQSRLAKTTIVSVAHRPSLKAFHSSFLHVRPGPELSERLHEADAKRA